MGKITSVSYMEVDPKSYNADESNESYWYQNMMGISSKIDKEYIDYEDKQIKTRNSLIHQLSESDDVNLKVDSTIFGLSSISNKVVLISETQ